MAYLPKNVSQADLDRELAEMCAVIETETKKPDDTDIHERALIATAISMVRSRTAIDPMSKTDARCASKGYHNPQCYAEEPIEDSGIFICTYHKTGHVCGWQACELAQATTDGGYQCTFTQRFFCETVEGPVFNLVQDGGASSYTASRAPASRQAWVIHNPHDAGVFRHLHTHVYKIVFYWLSGRHNDTLPGVPFQRCSLIGKNICELYTFLFRFDRTANSVAKISSFALTVLMIMTYERSNITLDGVVLIPSMHTVSWLRRAMPTNTERFYRTITTSRQRRSRLKELNAATRVQRASCSKMEKTIKNAIAEFHQTPNRPVDFVTFFK